MLTLLAAAAFADPSCADAALDVLRRHDPDAARLVKQLDEPAFFAAWLRCDDPPDYDVTLAVHEVVHRLGGFEPTDPDAYTLVLTSGAHTVRWEAPLFPRSELYALLDPAERGHFATTYLTGQAGDADGLLVLDELNAYARSLRTEAALRRRIKLPPGQMVGARDGVAVSLYWLALYAKRAREAHPDAWARLAEPDLAALIAAVWGEAEAALAIGCAQPNLGIEDGWYLKRVYDGLAAEVTALSPGLTPALPASCKPVVARAARPDPALALAQARVATFTETVQKVERTLHIEVNGEVLTVEELRLRARLDPALRPLLEQAEQALRAAD